MSTAASRRTLFAGAAAVVLGSGVTAGVAASVADYAEAPDADLLELGRRLNAEWRRVEEWCVTSADQSDEGMDAVMSPGQAIVEQIEHMRAQTFEGIKVKALAISYCNWGAPIDPDRFNPFHGAATDGRIAASLVRDLLAAGEA